MKKLIIYFTVLLILMSAVFAQTLTLSYSREDSSFAAYSFEEEKYVDYDMADVTFVGFEDKFESFQYPFLYTDNLNGDIVLKTKNCLEENYVGDKKQPILEGQVYCLKTLNELKFIELNVLSLNQGWENITLEFTEITELVQISDFEKITSSTYKKKSPLGIYHDLVFYILLDLLLLDLIIIFMLETRKFQNEKK
jgi:hypothetical protein